jgi:hypothetical protein
MGMGYAISRNEGASLVIGAYVALVPRRRRRHPSVSEPQPGIAE